jgi:PAS domain S-box-containing protein
VKRVLLVDDDEGLLAPVANYLARRGDNLQVLTAGNGGEAIDILANTEVDLVLSDLCMPHGDGVDLFAYMSAHRPHLPFVVMSGYVLPEDVEALARHGNLRCLRKPMGPSQMYDAIVETLRTTSETASVNHFSLTGILQLVEIEEKTCLVKAIRNTGEHGSFFFVKGKMQRALQEGLRGEDAALEMLTWEKPSIRVKPLLHMEDAHLGPDHSVGRLIEQSMEQADREKAEREEERKKQERRGKAPTRQTRSGPGSDKGLAYGKPAPPGAPGARLREIRLVLLIASMLIVYHLTFHLSTTLQGFFGEALRHPFLVFLNQALFFWILGLMWIVFRRWFAASRREADFSAILASTGPELLMVIDADRNVVMCSEAVEGVLGYELGEVMHRKADTLFEHAPDPRMEESVYDALRKFGFHRGEGLGKCKDGRSVHLEIITNRLQGHRGEVVLIRDISARKDHERRLCEARETAEAAVREREQALTELEQSYRRLKEAESLRDSLTHMVVHDMKSPLMVVESYLYLLQDQVGSGCEDAEVREYLASTLSQTRRLNLMVHTLLDASRLEAGRMDLRPQTGSLRATIEGALQFVCTPDETHRIRIACEVEPDLFSFDPDVLQRVLANLVTNAIKYDNDGGDIVVEVQAEAPWVTVAVLDRGPGIPEPRRERIFEKFGRIDGDGRHHSGSSGLGLTFCRMAVEAHGGRIGVSPREGGGSRFWFTLPFQAALRKQKEATPARV